MKSLRTLLTLTFTASVLGGMLALAAHFTLPFIEKNRTRAEHAQIEELQIVLNNAMTVLDPLQTSKRKCKLLSEILQNSTRGYGGEMKIAVAFKGQTVLGVRVIAHQETPGFADVLNPNDWLGTFAQRPLNDIDTVSRATITTSAVLHAVRRLTENHKDSIEQCSSKP